jgi:ABC-type multidrug transport system fused ATPase/permease subunit
MDLQALREQLSVVTQDALLFDDTIRANICLGLEPTQVTLERTVVAANLSDFLDRLPEGLETRVGPRGAALSGGQRQRVAIARALLRDTPILLLDEATSALDANSEAKVQAALDSLSKERTTIVIAHRLATIRKADQIIVMDGGRVVDAGTHDQLIERGGLYAQLCQIQFQA